MKNKKIFLALSFILGMIIVLTPSGSLRAASDIGGPCGEADRGVCVAGHIWNSCPDGYQSLGGGTDCKSGASAGGICCALKPKAGEACYGDTTQGTCGQCADAGDRIVQNIRDVSCASPNYCCKKGTSSADVECTKAGGNCNSTAPECIRGGGVSIPGVACSDSSYVCCKPGETPDTAVPSPGGSCGNGGTCKTSCADGEEIDVTDTCRTATPYCCVSKGTKPANTVTPGGTVENAFPNPLKYNTLQELLGSLLKTLQGIVALIAIIMLIVGGIMYMMAGVDEKMMETAKKTIGGALIGVAIIFAAPAFLKEILKIIGGTDESGLLANALTLKQIAENILNLLLSIVGILGIIGLVVGGVFYMTSYGDEDRIKKGKDIITASILGILIAAASLILVRQIAVLLAK